MTLPVMYTKYVAIGNGLWHDSIDAGFRAVLQEKIAEGDERAIEIASRIDTFIDTCYKTVEEVEKEKRIDPAFKHPLLSKKETECP